MILEVKNYDLGDIDELVRGEISGVEEEFSEDIFSFASGENFSKNVDTVVFEFTETVDLTADEEEFDVIDLSEEESGEVAEKEVELTETTDLETFENAHISEDFKIEETVELSADEEDFEEISAKDFETETQEEIIEKPPKPPEKPVFNGDILDYIRQNSGCGKEEVLRYFSNAELEKFLLTGRVILRRGGLIVMF
ncbi:MAG: hypothetical protein LBM93_00735 [Oscillospiraceae bacterium]|jgi:hypothetical protein|nr:hypothetical protein [Oscillospiraceae bacterium]